ncbi:UbiH/UbiF/VisC/COQ6 family ubiquinone biosynthesis hydroxylase [Candidatus Methylospira mobilis]|uniref:UbiH/UbiF/VisC/COQ6 family ubiquinone biosynthesis hydroxylase n=1 Tax=Candidatus Methylospira mobilis TaxID=1808979 RepID=A0A5Q0BG59_9GAMM|nr:UbiH/UbiF/VisC/COQ6 family ubiquinone biosynthesis hydroxylase [Candidatus Methylospira mobilis]QFY42823.1 UbiH/UbiF/VisC/COQ6 family ubiquinone biosynthesis hydroxylase [Candidatus Methylospira mobilis]WNV03715.1 UbiH/UbiF/VisC/COQ6 family ubiquinone biosynthesis hydroxylase [Candidatus Methylospira mobilis]
MREYYDVAIVGGGMVGAALGCSLGNSGLKAVVLEETPPPPFDSSQSHDLRVSAVSIASASIIRTVGAWPGIASRRSCPFRRMRVWENQGYVEFRSDEINEQLLGYIVENRVVQLALQERLAAFDNIEFLCPVKIADITYSAKQSSLRMDDGREIVSRLLVAADGGSSRARQAAGMGVSAWDYEQHALVLTVETAYDQQDITWQRFEPSGPLAFLPLDGPHASLVWYQTPEEVKRLKQLSDDDLLQAARAAFPKELGEIKCISARGSFPLKRQHALHYTKEGVALIGDAAHMIHPLAGQGVNIGLLDAAALAQVLVGAQREGRDVGSAAVLKSYEKMRRHDNLVMMTAMDLFYRVFGNSNQPLRLLRNIGLGLAEHVTPAKKMVMKHAMGLGGNLPRLARGEAIVF